MKLFIPELGTKLKLTKNWKLNVQWEDRNLTLIKFFNQGIFKQNEILKKESSRCFFLGWKDGYEGIGKLNEYKDFDTDLSDKNPVIQKAKDWLNLQRKISYDALKNFRSKNPIIYNFLKGTILEIDRIYIRKGAEDYSSVTFKWRINNKVIRFWAKLEDVNKIEFELVN